MDNQYFRVIGDEELLKHCQINLLKIDEQGHETVETILCKGKLNQVKVENEIACIYKFYVSYNNSCVEMLDMENIFRNASDQVNYLFLEKKEDLIYLKFVGRKADLNDGFQKKLISNDEYFKLNNIQNKNEIKQQEFLFFECHP